MTKRKYRTDEEWLSLIQECRLSGLTDKQWCEAHQICPGHPVPVPGKKYIVTDFSTFGTVYVIIRVLLYLIYSYPSYITLEIIVKFLERIHLSAIRLFHHAPNRFWINFSRFRTDIILQQNEDYQSHIAKPWLSVRFSNDRFWRIIHHIFVAIPYQFVLSS